MESLGRCFCFKNIKKYVLSLVISTVLFAKLYESKPVFPLTRERRFSGSTNSGSARKEIRLLIKDLLPKKDENILDRFARETDKIFVEQIRAKRKKREFGCVAYTNRRTVRMLSKTGFFLEILSSGKVGGHVNKTLYTKLELQVITAHVKRIKSVKTGKYLAINAQGRVIAKDECDRETYFYEEVSENMNYLYSSIKYPRLESSLSWYIGLRKKHGKKSVQGRVKRASRTLPGESATHFSVLFEGKR